MAFVIFFALGTRIDQHHIGLLVDLFLDPICRHARIVSSHFHIAGKSFGKNFDVGIAELFRFGSGFMAQGAFKAAAIKNEQRIFIRRQ